MSLTYRLYTLLWGSLDILFPSTCGGCDQAGYRWCPDCLKKILNIPESVCRFCGVPLSTSDLCKTCAENPPSFRALRSWLIFDGPIRLALHHLKYRRDMALGDALARHFASFVNDLDWTVDAVVPVPLGRKMMAERGYNQVGMVAQPLAGLLGWKYLPGALTRRRETGSQVGLSPEERKRNVSGAFLGKSDRIQGSTILFVDDVTTNGATISACALALREAGAGDVYAVTLARAMLRDDLQVV